MTPKAECINPTMKQSLALFLSVLNFFKKNTNESFKILSELNIQTDHIIEDRRPGKIIADKTNKKTKLLTWTFLQVTGLKFASKGKLKIIKI